MFTALSVTGRAAARSCCVQIVTGSAIVHAWSGPFMTTKLEMMKTFIGFQQIATRPEHAPVITGGSFMTKSQSTLDYQRLLQALSPETTTF